MKNVSEKETLAASIFKEFGLQLADKWEDKINVWHMFHHHGSLKCWHKTYDEYLDRIIHIKNWKRSSEHEARYKAIRPVKNETLKHIDVDDEFKKIHNARFLEYDNIVKEARERIHKAEIAMTGNDAVDAIVRVAAYEAFLHNTREAVKKLRAETSNFDKIAGISISEIHKIECPDVPFDEIMNRINFS